MNAIPHLRVPVGPDPERWRTFPGERTLVAVARTLTSTVRILDVLPSLLGSDPRVDVVFAYDPTSAFNDGVLDLLRSVDGGVRVMPWEQLPEIETHLFLTATENADFTGTTADVLVLPHGVGFHKQVPDARGEGTRISGVPAGLLAEGRAWLAISHPAQEEQLRAAHPEIAGRTVLAGDPALDRLHDSERMRAGYRRALGVRPDQRLVLVTSTWRTESLIGRHPGLPARLLAELPYDDYRVAAVLHPNAWHGHGPAEVARLQADALPGGLLLIPPAAGWPATLVAADLVIGDHGSVTFYGAALGKPLLLGAFGEEAEPDTPMAELGSAVDTLDPSRALLPQLEAAWLGHDPERLAKITESAFADPGRTVEQLRRKVYELLDLSVPPRRPRELTCPEPVPVAAPPVRSFLVSTTTVRELDGRWVVALRRAPATAAGEETGPAGDWTRHLSCSDRERDTRLLASASTVTVEEQAHSTVAGRARLAEVFEQWPYCRVAAVRTPHGFLTALWDGRVVEAALTGPRPDPVLPAAAVYAALLAGLPLADTTVELQVGERTFDVALRTLGQL